MEQEKLTIDHIRYDLRHAVKINFSICFFVGSFLLVLVFLLFVIFSGMDMPVRLWAMGLLCAGASKKLSLCIVPPQRLASL